jgi:hypothetical protein
MIIIGKPTILLSKEGAWNCTMSFREVGSMINNQVNIMLRVTLIQYYRTHSLVLGLVDMQFRGGMCERGL